MNGGIWTRETVAMLLLACFLPMAASWVWYGGHLSLAFLVLMIVYGWQLLFLLARAQAPSLSGVITALAVAMLAPEQLGPLRLASVLASSWVNWSLAVGAGMWSIRPRSALRSLASVSPRLNGPRSMSPSLGPRSLPSLLAVVWG